MGDSLSHLDNLLILLYPQNSVVHILSISVMKGSGTLMYLETPFLSRLPLKNSNSGKWKLLFDFQLEDYGGFGFTTV